MEKINYIYVSSILEKIGWISLSGTYISPDSQWEHWRIGRRFTTYEAALCHNLLVNIFKMKPRHPLFKETRDKLRLFANGWSLRLESLENQDAFISINDLHFWKKQNHSGGRVFTDEEAQRYVELNNDLDYFFLDYLAEVASKGELISSDVEKRESLHMKAIAIKPAFVLEGINEYSLGRGVLVLLGPDSKTALSEIREKLKIVSTASCEAQEALDRILSTVDVSTDEETD